MTNYTNSSLIDVTMRSRKYSKGRNAELYYITPHCFVGQVTAEGGGRFFQTTPKDASCNYVIGKEGRVCLVVDEANRSWCSGGSGGEFDNGKIFPKGQGGDWNDNRAITIECASDSDNPYTVTDACYKKLVDLCTDICRRYNKKRLIWAGSLWYQVKPDELALTAHRWFAAKACPGNYLYSKFGELADEVTKRLASGESQTTDGTLYRVQTGAFSKKENAENYASELNKQGIKTVIKEDKKA